MNNRKTAYDIITDVLKNGTYLNLALKDKLRGVDAQEKRFVSALCYTTLENLIRIDYIIKQFTSGTRIHSDVKNALRIGVCQLMFFETVPESAAVNESVNVLPKKDKRQRGFANAVLRRIANEAGHIEYPDFEKQPIKYLSVMYSYPEWLCKKYAEDYGIEFAEQMLAYGKANAYTCVRMNNLKTNKEDFEAKLKGADIEFKKGAYIEEAYYIKNIEDIENMKLFKTGALAVQSEASMLCVCAADIKNGDTVLDACAAPGGKTAYAACFDTDGKITSMEYHAHRAELMRKNFERLGVVNADISVADGTELKEEYICGFDRVLIDAPCSALGLLYRKPDIKHSKTDGDIEQLMEVQNKLLETCSNYVKKGGTLVYSTCTINADENTRQIESFLKKHKEFRQKELKNCMPEALMYRINGGMLQLFPHIDGTDGFFMAALEKIV